MHTCKKIVRPLITAIHFSDYWIKQLDDFWFYTVLAQMLFFAEAISSSLQCTWSGRLPEYISLATVGIISCPGESSFPNTPPILSAAFWASKTCPSVSDKRSRARSLKQSFPERCVTLYHVLIKTSSFSLAVCNKSWTSPNKEFYIFFSDNCHSK